ncbi:hypothetical protein NFI96_014116, partial [Prochilodus magdalenae]
MVADSQRTVVSSFVSAAPLADSWTTQNDMHALPRLSLTPRHRHQTLQWCRTRLSWSDSEWQRVIFSDESRFSLGGDAQRIRVWRHRGQHQDEWLVVTRPEGLVSLHLHPYRTICRNCVRMFKLHGMDYHRTPLGTSTAPYRDVWRVGLANTAARRHTERQTSLTLAEHQRLCRRNLMKGRADRQVDGLPSDHTGHSVVLQVQTVVHLDPTNGQDPHRTTTEQCEWIRHSSAAGHLSLTTALRIIHQPKLSSQRAVGSLLWAASCGQRPVGSVLWAASCGQPPVGSVLWAASCGQRPMGSILWGSVLWGSVLWAASYGQHPMGSVLWAVSCGQRPVGSVLWGSVLWAASYGQRPVGSVLWAVSCGQRPVGSVLWVASCGQRPVGSVLWAASLVWRCSGLSVRFLNKGPINVGLNNVLVLDAKFELRPGEYIRLVTWDRKVDSTENRLVTNDEPTDKARISVENGRARLRLINVRGSDQGLYVITVTDGNGDQTSASLFVQVVQRPPKAKLSLDCSMVMEGAQWDIPVFSWWVDGVQVDNRTANHSADGSKLHLSGSLANNYTCIITSSLGTTRVQHLR